MATLFDAAPVWLTWSGMETDLIFNKGVDLPGFAAFPLLDSAKGRSRIAAYYDQLLDLGAQAGVGVLLETVTWMANPDRAAPLGYDARDLDRLNAEAVALARAARARAEARGTDVAALVSLQVGPRADGYAAGGMTATEAESYHAPQIAVGAAAGADIASAYTLGAVGEAVGIVRAAAYAGLPHLPSFTVETDGRLADGTALAKAIVDTDAATGGSAVGYAVNCAHPDHIAPALDGDARMGRLCGIIANASRQSHVELDQAETLDDGDPAEFGIQLAALRKGHPGLRLLGGCCGTDLRHLAQIAARAA